MVKKITEEKYLVVILIVPSVLLTLSLFVCITKADENEYRLIRDIMEGYDKRVRPAKNASESLNVTFGVALAQLIDVDEKNQIITTNCWINQNWVDYELAWDPIKYGNISVIRIPFNQIWLPDILLYNNADVSSHVSTVSTNVIVSSDGNVTWLSMVIFKSSCSIDVQYFPFDKQNCSLEFGSWTFDRFSVNLIMTSGDGDTTNYVDSSEWELIRFRSERVPVFFSCCPDEPYIFIKYYILINRRPLFYLFNMVLPCVLITLIALLGFYMPSDSGEKISMGITTLLSMTVFLMIVTESMPPTSDALPLIGLYYGITIGIVSFATAFTVMTLNIHHKGARGVEIPPFARKLFFGVLAKVLFIRLDLPNTQDGMVAHGPHQHEYYVKLDKDLIPENGSISPRFSRSNTSATTVSGSENYEKHFMKVLQKVYTTIEQNERRLADQDRRDNIRQEWQQLALVIDRTLLFCFTVATVTVTLSLLLRGLSI